MKKLQLFCSAAAAFGLAAQVQAGVFAGSTDFEEVTSSDAYFSGGTDGYAIESVTVSATPRPDDFGKVFKSTRAEVLALDASADDPVLRVIADDPASLDGGEIYTDLLVKGTPATDTPDVTSESDKLLVYFKANGSTTNLCVLAAAGENDATATEYVCTTAVDPDAWNRVVIVANKGTARASFSVYCGDYASANLCQTSGGVSTFYSLTTDQTLSSVGFAGTGYIDDFVVSTYTPGIPLVSLKWDTAVASASYSVDGGAAQSLTASAGSYEFQAAAGSVVTLTLSSPYTTFSETATVSGNTTVDKSTTSASSAAWYFANGSGTQADPYLIPNLTALKALQAAVANGVGADLYYQQTADIALDAAWPGIGIQNGKDIYTTADFNTNAFCGTYDGGNYTVSNFQMQGGGLDYCGFFNSTYGATIKNLKIEYAGSLFAADTTSSSGESGATFVGVAKNSTLQNLTSLAGNVSCAKGFGGIVGYLTSGSTVSYCTNNVNITSMAPNKAGGIAMITQGGSAVTIQNCVNNGTTDGNANQKGGIVGYIGLATTIADCTVTAGSAPSFFSWNTGTVTVSGENTAPASVLPCKTTGGAVKTISGLTFATVDNGVATFVADNTLASGNTYKVFAPGTATYTLAAAGDTIAFDTALATPTFAITAAEGLAVTSATEGTVTTYTAVVPISLSPASLELYPNCSNYVQVVGAPAGSTYKFKFEGAVGSGGFSPTDGWGKPYGSKPGLGTVTATVSNNNEQVAQLVCNVTVKDVVAVVDGVEYATADWTTAVSTAIASDKVFEVYYNAANITLAEGQSLRWKPADNRGQGKVICVAPAATASAMYKVTSTKDTATGITTAVCTNEGAPNVMITKADNSVSYNATLTMTTANATYTLLRSFTKDGVVNASAAGVVLDLNGKTLTVSDYLYVRKLLGSASLTIRDTSEGGAGAIVGTSAENPLIWVNGEGNADTVTIEGGSFSGLGALVYTYDGGTATITGGTFESVSTSYMLNCNDSNKGTITVTGGSFNGFDPANNAADGAGTDYVAEGYKSEADTPSAGWYTVVVDEPEAELEPIDLGTALTAEDIANGIEPAAFTSEGFEVNFRGQAGVTYTLVTSTSCALTEEQWKAADAASGNNASKTASEDNELITLKDSDTEAMVKFYKIKSSK